MRKSILAFSLLLAPLALAQPKMATTVDVDARDARRAVFHVHLNIPVEPGPLTLLYPKWIPGEHTPTGPITQMAGLHFHSGSSEIAWVRDAVDMFAFHINVPPGATTIDADFDYLSPSTTFGDGYGMSPNSTQNLLLILFNHVVLYRSGIPTDQLPYQASVSLPAGWHFDTALPVVKRDGDRVQFASVSLTTLIDSPLAAGSYQRIIPIADGGREHVTITADSESALAMSDDRIAQVRNLVAETDALFGARHYREYHWLVTLSDQLMPQGLEHHESTDIRHRERDLTDDADGTARTITILAHEFVHSWNGKYRRPAGLATPDYQAPMLGELLFVYEGMTRYYGDLVLSARTGMRTQEQDREYAAFVAANQDRNRPGRNWRPIADTSAGVASISGAPGDGVSYRRGLDYYDESMLVWLDVDTTIRQKSSGRHSLDDFAKIFFGAPSASPAVKPYTFDDVVTALNEVVVYDWRSFLNTRFYEINAHPPLGALEASGWRLVYNDQPNWYVGVREHSDRNHDYSFSLGLWTKDDGTISDVVFGGPAYRAGLVSGMKIVAVDDRAWDARVLHEEVALATNPARSLQVGVQQGTFAGTFTIDYHAGDVYPHLERVAGTPDLLAEILKAHASSRK